MPTVTMKKGDTAPVIAQQLLDGAGNVVPLSGTARILLLNVVSGVKTVGHAAVPTYPDAPNGKIAYTPDATDSANPGTWRVEWEITFTGGAIETFPQRRGNDEILFIVSPGSK